MSFFFIVMGILSFSYWYTGWRIIVPAGIVYPYNIILWVLAVVFLILPFVSIFIRLSGYYASWVYVLTWVAYISIGFMTLLFLGLIARDIIVIGLESMVMLSEFIMSRLSEGNIFSGIITSDRHRSIINMTNLALIVSIAMLIVYGIVSALRGPKVVEVTVPIEGLHHDLDGFRILQLTDIHAGSTLREPYIRNVADIVQDLDFDLIALTGDLADGQVHNLRQDIAPLGELSAPHGKYFVTGNHEYYMGVEPWMEEARRLGYTVLNNEHRIITRGEGSMILAGISDIEAGRFRADHESSPIVSREGAPEGLVSVLLAHQPRSIFGAASAGFDLVITGHTHGGQYFPWMYFVGLQQPYTSGLHRHGKSWIYISRGTGYWGPPIRVGAPSEITVITLKRK